MMLEASGISSKAYIPAQVRARLLFRLRREAVNVSGLDVESIQGEVSDPHSVYVRVSCKRTEQGTYIEPNVSARRQLLQQVSDLIAEHHWSLGRVQESQSIDCLVYYWPSNLSPTVASPQPRNHSVLIAASS